MKYDTLLRKVGNDYAEMYKCNIGYFKEPLYLNSFYLILTTIISTGSGFFFWMITAKFYSPKDVGFSVAIISAIGLLSLFTRFGLEIGIIRYLPTEDEKSSMINWCLAIILLTSIVVAVIYLLGLEIFSPDLVFMKKESFLLFSFIVFTAAYSIYIFENSVFIALRDTKYSLLQSIVAMLRIIVLPILTSIGFLGIYISYGVGFVIAVVCGNIFISKLIPRQEFNSQKRNSIIKEMIHFSIGNYIAIIFEAMPNFLYPLLIINILGPEMNAYFYIAWSFAAILFVIPKATSTSLFAEGLYSIEELNANSIKASKFIMILLIPSILIIFCFGDKILSLFGHDYSESALGMLKLLAISAIPYSFNMLSVSIKRVEKKIASVIYIHLALMICSIILSVILIKRIGLDGIGYGWLIANIIINLTLIVLPIKKVPLQKFKKHM